MNSILDKFQALVDDQTIVGMAVTIVQQGDIVHSRGFGVTGVESYQLAVTPDTLFAIGSITKSVAAATIMCLVEGGKLNLDTPIVHYLDGFDFDDQHRGRKVTLRHLLSHSSGLPQSGRNWGLRGRDALRTFMWDDLRHHRFVFEPGQAHIYSNTAISSIAYVAEMVTQTPFDELVQSLIFDPLDMSHSTFNPIKAITYPLALPHHTRDDGNLQVTHRVADNEMGHASSFCYCSTHDLAKFSVALMKPNLLFHADTLNEMQTPAIRLRMEGANYPGALMNAAFGLGLSLGTYRGYRLVRHGGMNLSYNCVMDTFPEQQLSVVLQSNYMADERAFNILFELYDHLLQPTAPLRPPAPPTVPEAIDANLTGEYFNPADGIVTLTKNDGQLILNDDYPLICIGQGRYYYLSDTLRFPVAIEGEVLFVRSIPYQRLERPLFTPDLEQWSSYVGDFIDPLTPYPDETAIRVAFDGKQLLINDVPQDALSNTRFVSALGIYDFISTDLLQVRMGMRFERHNHSED